ncbi:MAG: alkaline phosphatase [Alistipes sp.]|nr:alkaline phosphatase [Alistipes sp.]
MKKCFFALGACLLAACAPSADREPEIRNVVYMIGDGMGLAQVSLLQIAEDYRPTAFDRAQGIALITTRSANNRVTDSAAAGTALSTGTKTNNASLGIDPAGEPLVPMSVCAREQGMRTGLVVTCYLHHATPGAFYAHVSNRSQTDSITCDMVRSDIDLLFGGGRKALNVPLPEGGTRFDALRAKGYRVALEPEQIDTLSGLPAVAAVAEKHLPVAAERGDYLPRATRKALELLSADNDKGFFLMVEGSQIDMACHGNDAPRVLDEMRDFEQAVAAAMDFADTHPGTLVVVTADHETGGLTLPSGKDDFTLPESGVRTEFSTGGHSASIVPVYLYGTGAGRIRGLMDNTDLARQLKAIIAKEK